MREKKLGSQLQPLLWHGAENPASMGDAALDQEQPGSFVTPILYVSRATLDPERHWTLLDLEVGSIFWVIKGLRG